MPEPAAVRANKPKDVKTWRFGPGRGWSAFSRPPKDKPWYHVLVNNALYTTHVAEQNLEAAETPKRIVHPYADRLFSKFDGERYHLRQQTN